MAPTWTKLADHYQLLKSDYQVNIHKVDCTVDQKVCSGQGIRGYPTLKIWRGQNSFDYAGRRDLDSVVSYIDKLTGPSVTEVGTDFEHSVSDISVILKSKDPILTSNFENIASKYYLNDNFLFAKSPENENLVEIYNKNQKAKTFSLTSDSDLAKIIQKHMIQDFHDFTARNWIQWTTKNLEFVMDRKLILVNLESTELRPNLQELANSIYSSSEDASQSQNILSDKFIFGFTDSAVIEYISDNNIEASKEVLIGFDCGNKNVFDLTSLYHGDGEEKEGNDLDGILDLMLKGEIEPSVFGEKYMWQKLAMSAKA